MMLQAWHIYFWTVSPILLCKTSQAPSGWMGSVGAWVSRVQVWATLVHSPSCPVATPFLIFYLGCVRRVVVLLEGELPAQSEILNHYHYCYLNILVH